MKIYSTKKFVKNAQFNNLPGDPSYPPGMRSRDVDPGFESPGTPINIQETIDLKISRDWDDYKQWYTIDNETGLLAGKAGVSNIDVNLTFKAEGHRESSDNFNINFKVNKITSDAGDDITKYEIHEGEEEIIRNKLEEVIKSLL